MYRYSDHVNSRYAEIKTPTSIEDLQLIGQYMRTYLTERLEEISLALETDFEINSLNVKSNKGEVELIYSVSLGDVEISGTTQSYKKIIQYVNEITDSPKIQRMVDSKISDLQEHLISDSMDIIQSHIEGNATYPWTADYDIEFPHLDYDDFHELVFDGYGFVEVSIKDVTIHYGEYDIHCRDTDNHIIDVTLGEDTEWVSSWVGFVFDPEKQLLVPEYNGCFFDKLDTAINRLVRDYDKSNSLVDFNKELTRKLRNYYPDEDVKVDRFGRPTIGNYKASDLTVDPVGDPHADDAFKRVKKNYSRYNKRRDRNMRKEQETYDGELDI